MDTKSITVDLIEGLDALGDRLARERFTRIICLLSWYAARA